MKPPRAIFRARRNRNRGLVVTDQPGAPYHAAVLEAALKAGLDLKPGTLTQAVVWHDPDCPRPRGGACKCKDVDVELVPIGDPARN